MGHYAIGNVNMLVKLQVGEGQEQQQEQQVKAEIHSHSHYYLVQVMLLMLMPDSDADAGADETCEKSSQYIAEHLWKLLAQAEDGSIMELPGLTNQPMEVVKMITCYYRSL